MNDYNLIIALGLIYFNLIFYKTMKLNMQMILIDSIELILLPIKLIRFIFNLIKKLI